MSRNDYESGRIVLPSAAFAAVRKATQDALMQRRQKTLEVMERAYKEAPPAARRSIAAFEAHLDSSTTVRGYYHNTVVDRYEFPDFGDRWTMLGAMRGADGRVKTPRQSHLGPAPTNRTLEFHSGGGRLTFDPAAKTVEWDVDEGNHAVERARKGIVFQGFLRALDQVKWTRNTGGHFHGNDEYNLDAAERAGDGADYVTTAFGPIGAIENPHHFRPFTDSAGVKHTPGDSSYATKGLKEQAANARATARMYAAMAKSSQGRVSRGVPAGGQFAGRSYGDDTIRLR